MPVTSNVKIFVLFLVFIISTFHAQANNSTIWGLKLGFLSSGVYTDPEIIGRENGISGFLFWDHYVTEWFSLEHNIGYVQRGFRNTQTLTDDQGFFVDDITARTRTGYLSYNPMFGIHRFTPDHAKVFIAVGPRIEYLVKNRKGTFELPGNVEVVDSVAENLDDWIWGFAVTTGLKAVELGEGELRFSVGYHLDISDSISQLSDRSARNNALIFTFGIGF